MTRPTRSSSADEPRPVRPTARPKRKPLRQDFELELYLSTFKSSSDRVRYVILLLIVMSLLTLVGSWNSRQHSWSHRRLYSARATVEHFIDTPDAPLPAYAESRNIKNLHEAQVHLDHIEAALTERVLNIEVPVLGLNFDTNDLGVIGGAALALVMGILIAAVVRQHENLCICLWKVCDLHEQECALHGKADFESPRSKANLLYHALAMLQVFSSPPTRVRWRRTQKLDLLLAAGWLFLPFLAHMLVFASNVLTARFAMTLKPAFPPLGIWIQGSLATVLFFEGLTCLAFSYAENRRWRMAFFKINKSFEKKTDRTWLEFLMLSPLLSGSSAKGSKETGNAPGEG